jgi:hypothetical protein
MFGSAQLFLYAETALLAILIIRAIQGGQFSRYRIFSSYICYQFGMGIAVFILYTLRSNSYLAFYWYIQFVSVALGFAVIWEIYSHTFRSFPGTLKLARFTVSILFIAILTIAVIDAFWGEPGGLTRRVIGFERNVRAAQAILLIGLLALIWLYSIPLGRNLGGLIWGYGVFIGISIVTLALRAYIGPSFEFVWQLLQQSSYLVTLMIWVPSFWTYQEVPKFESEVVPRKEYSTLVERSSRDITDTLHAVLRVFQQ